MASARYSGDAELDLAEILHFSKLHWTSERSISYVKKLRDAGRMLAKSPGIARAFGPLHPETRRYEVGSHVIFFRIEAGGIFVLRILHERMLPQKHLS